MLDLKFVRENIAIVEEALPETRRPPSLSTAFVALDRRAGNGSSKWRGCGRSGTPLPRRSAACVGREGRVGAHGADEGALDSAQGGGSGTARDERKMEEFLLAIPNVPDPWSRTARGRRTPVVRTWGPRAFNVPGQGHVDLGAGWTSSISTARRRSPAGGSACRRGRGR